MPGKKEAPAAKAVARAAAKGRGGCNCWEGYDRAPGTKPCAPGSCVKKGKK